MNTALVKRDLLDSLSQDAEYRHAWNLENVYTGVAFQIRALREQRQWSQATLGEAAKMAPERISILEDPNAGTKPTLTTLLRIANACDVGLDVRFVPYGTVIDRSVNTNQKDLEVPSFEDELPTLEQTIKKEGGASAISFLAGMTLGQIGLLGQRSDFDESGWGQSGVTSALMAPPVSGAIVSPLQEIEGGANQAGTDIEIEESIVDKGTMRVIPITVGRTRRRDPLRRFHPRRERRARFATDRFTISAG